jgi:hypothetical protein
MAEGTPPGPAKVTVTTTMRPSDPIEVTEHEAAVLRHQGLLAEDAAVPAADTPPPASPAKGKAADKPQEGKP